MDLRTSPEQCCEMGWVFSRMHGKSSINEVYAWKEVLLISTYNFAKIFEI